MAQARSRSQRIQFLESLSRNETNELAYAMQQAALLVKADQAKLAELEEYRRSYGENGAGQDAVVSSMQLVEMRTFLGRLGEAIEAQRLVVQNAQSRYEPIRAAWIAKRLRTNALGRVVERFRLEETAEAMRREQQAHDEIALRQLQTKKI